MTLPKKAARKITVEGRKYRWNSSGNDYGIDIFVEREQCYGQIFRFTYPYQYDDENVQTGVTPSIVEAFIKIGLKEGWEPDKTGSFEMKWHEVEKYLES